MAGELRGVILRSGHCGDGFQFESMPGYFVSFWLCVLQHSIIAAAEEPTYYVSSVMASRVDNLWGPSQSPTQLDRVYPALVRTPQRKRRCHHRGVESI